MCRQILSTILVSKKATHAGGSSANPQAEQIPEENETNNFEIIANKAHLLVFLA